MRTARSHGGPPPVADWRGRVASSAGIAASSHLPDAGVGSVPQRINNGSGPSESESIDRARVPPCTRRSGHKRSASSSSCSPSSACGERVRSARRTQNEHMCNNAITAAAQSGTSCGIAGSDASHLRPQPLGGCPRAASCRNCYLGRGRLFLHAIACIMVAVTSSRRCTCPVHHELRAMGTDSAGSSAHRRLRHGRRADSIRPPCWQRRAPLGRRRSPAPHPRPAPRWGRAACRTFSIGCPGIVFLLRLRLQVDLLQRGAPIASIGRGRCALESCRASGCPCGSAPIYASGHHDGRQHACMPTASRSQHAGEGCLEAI